MNLSTLGPISGPLTGIALPALSGEAQPLKAGQARALRLAAGIQRLEALHTEMLFRLVELADADEPDADLEPSLCGVGAARQVFRERHISCLDLEEQCEDEGAETGDDEPWLAAPEGCQNYSFSGGYSNYEEQCDDEGAADWQLEPDADGEPSLCGLTADTPPHTLVETPLGEIYNLHTRDLEAQCEDEGFDSDSEPEGGE